MIGIFINLWNRLIGAGGAAISYVLDEYSGAAAAYSLRKLSSTYGGSAVRVRRASDNAEQDIGFVGQDLDETALMNFVGYQNLFLQSQTFNTANWFKNSSTVTENAGTDPFGGNNATRWVGSSTHFLAQSVILINGQSYTISFYIKSNTGSNQLFRFLACDTITSSDLTATNDWQRFTFSFVANTSVTHGIIRPSSNAASDLLVYGAQINVGTTAQPYQVTTSAARSGDGFVTKWYTQDSNWENLILQSQTFENASWTKNTSSITQNSTTAPDGTLTADSLNEISGFNRFPVFQPVTLSSLGLITASVYLKAKERRYAVVSITTGSSGAIRYGVVVDLQDGLIVGSASVNSTTNTSNSISNAGNGWYRVSVSMNATTTAANSNYIVICPSNSPTPTYEVGTLDPLYNGTAGSGVFIWGAQLSQSSWLQGYQATTTSQVFRRDASQSTAANQPRIVGGGVIERENGKAAIRFDGTNDFLSLASDITYTTTGNQYISAVFTPAVAITVANIYVPLATIGTADSRMIYALGSVTSSLVNERLSYLTVIGGNVLGYGQTVSDLSPTPKLQSISFDPPSLFNIFQNSIQQQFSTSTSGAFSSSQYPSTFGRIGASPSPSSFFLGDMQEIILYGTSRSANRGDIDRNVGAYYQTQWTGASSGLLDQFGGAAAAYSLRNLSSSYRGPLIRVRRSSDNAETDIGGTYNGDLDVASLVSFTGGQNLLTNSEDFTNANWVKDNSSVTANATIAPDGTLTADKFIESAISGVHRSTQNHSPSASNIFTFSVYAKAAERRYIALNFYSTFVPYSTVYANIDLLNGTVVSSGTFASATLISYSVQSVGNGWYRCSVTGTTNASSQIRVDIATLINETTATYLGVAGSGVYIWGAQLNTGILQPYIPTTTTAVNGANAFVTKWYTQDNNYQNLLLQSEAFETANWIKFGSTITQNVISDPNGTLTADKLNETGTTAQHGCVQNYTISTAQVHTLSFYAKAAERSNIAVVIYLNGGVGDNFIARYNLSTGVVQSTGTAGAAVLLSSSIQPVGDGWYRCSITGNTNVTGSHSCQISILDASFANTYLGVAGSGIYIWGAQLSEGAVLQPYTATTTTVSQRRDAIQATAASQPRIVNAGGVESEGNRPALFFDGVDDFLQNTTDNPFTFTGPVSLIHASYKNSTAYKQYETLFSAGTTGNSSNNTARTIGFGYGNDAYPNPKPAIVTDIWSPSGVQQNGTVIAGESRITGYYIPNWSTHRTAGQTSIRSNGIDLNVIPYATAVPAGLNTNPIKIGSYDTILPDGFFAGDIFEIIAYNSNRSSSRVSIESNINSYYRIYWQGNGTALLDNFSGASAAYSLRNLSSAYTGPLIRVRRSSDNVERDIYGTFGGDLDIASLVAFVGVNSGFVTTWYDQSGNARHATQATAGNQPRIVNAGVVETEGGKPSINFAGTARLIVSTGLNIIQNVPAVSMYSVLSTTSTSSDQSAVLISTSSSGASRLLFGVYTTPTIGYVTGGRRLDANSFAGVYSSADTNRRLMSSFVKYISSDIEVYSSGVLAGSMTNFQTDGNTENTASATFIIGDNAVGNTKWMGRMQEITIYSNDQSASRTGTESNINNYYKIY